MIAECRWSRYKHDWVVEPDMHLKLLVLVVGLSVAAQAAEASDEPAKIIKFDTIGRSFSVSRNLSISEDRKRLDHWLETAPPENIPLKEELARQYNILPPPYLFDLAERTFSADIRAALKWYWLGHIRARLDAVLCADKSATEVVAYLPARARTVTKYIRTNPIVAGELGEETLTQPDLRDSQASPWWICSRGSGEKGSPDPLSWLVPEDEMAVRYAALMAEIKEMFGEMRQPMDDQITSLTPAIVPTVVAARRTITNVLWSRSKGLVLSEAIPGKDGKLSLWQGGKLRAIAGDVGSTNLCVSGDFVSYRTRAANDARTMSDAGAAKTLSYRAGKLDQSLEQYSYSHNDRRISPGGFQRARVDQLNFAPWSQNSLTCVWNHADSAQATKFNAAKSVEVGSAAKASVSGFLESRTSGLYYYAAKGAGAVQLSDTQFPLKCLKNIPFLDAVHMVACPVAYMSSDGVSVNSQLRNISLLKLDGAVPVLEQRELPSIPGERGDTQTLITKTGIVRLMKSRYTPVRKRPGGLYWFGWSDGDMPKKIWEGYPDQADVSDDGCKIAFSTIKSAASISRDRNVLVLDVCEAMSGSTEQ